MWFGDEMTRMELERRANLLSSEFAEDLHSALDDYEKRVERIERQRFWRNVLVGLAFAAIVVAHIVKSLW
jgi:hypothetical protein